MKILAGIFVGLLVAVLFIGWWINKAVDGIMK